MFKPPTTLANEKVCFVLVSKTQQLLVEVNNLTIVTVKSLSLLIGMLHDRLSRQVVLFTDNLDKRILKFKEYELAAILPMNELHSLVPSDLFMHLRKN